MSDLESHFHSSEGMISEEIDSRIEEYRSFVQESRNLVRGPETPAAVSESLVDSLTEEEVSNIRDKVFSCWETTKVSRLQVTEPTTQSEEAMTSFEDAKSDEVAKPLVQPYDIEKLIEAELKEIGNSRNSKDDSCPSKEATHEEKLTEIESMDFTEIEKEADLPGISGLESSQRTSPVLNTTDVLEVLLRIYDFSIVDSERAATYLAKSDTGDLSSTHAREVQEFRNHLAEEMKIIYERLVAIHSSGTHRAPENVESSDSSSCTKDSTSSIITRPGIVTPSIVVTPSAPSTISPYPDTTTSIPRAVDDTISSRPLSGTSDSGLIDLVIDTSSALPKTSDLSSRESTSDATTDTSSTSVSGEADTLSGISSLTTDPKVSVSSLRDVSTRTSTSSLRDFYSVSSMRGAHNRSSLPSMRDEDNLHQLLSERISDDAFTPPQDAIAETLPPVVDPAGAAQNPRRRGRSSKEEEDKNKAKKPAL